MLSRQGDCDAVMIGRLAVRKPWVFTQAKIAADNMAAPDSEHGTQCNRTQCNRMQCNRVQCVNIEETGLLFIELLSRFQPVEFHMSRARLFFSYFCDNLKWGNHVKNLLNRETDFSGMEQTWRAYFTGQPEDRYEKPV